MARKIKYSTVLKRHIQRHNLHEKIRSIIIILGNDSQEVFDWAAEEAKRRKHEQESSSFNLGKCIFLLVGHEAAIRLLKQNNARGRQTTKNEVRLKTGVKLDMPRLYRNAGLRHPQEARNLRHNLFHEAFMALIMHLFPDVETNVPVTGEGLTPDLMVNHNDPKWTLSVEYKGYRAITLLSESEILKGMRYQHAYGSSWLVTSSMKGVRELYGNSLTSDEIITRGLTRLESIYKRRSFTAEQRENKGIARKGISHLNKHKGIGLKCKLVSAEALLDSCRAGKPIKGLAITTGLEFIDMLREAGFNDHADNVLRIMKIPTTLLHSDKVTSIKLIE